MCRNSILPSISLNFFYFQIQNLFWSPNNTLEVIIFFFQNSLASEISSSKFSERFMSGKIYIPGEKKREKNQNTKPDTVAKGKKISLAHPVPKKKLLKKNKTNIPTAEKYLVISSQNLLPEATLYFRLKPQHKTMRQNIWCILGKKKKLYYLLPACQSVSPLDIFIHLFFHLVVFKRPFLTNCDWLFLFDIDQRNFIRGLFSRGRHFSSGLLLFFYFIFWLQIYISLYIYLYYFLAGSWQVTRRL